jgi:toxin-antitoxin system PIN domain toxin
VRTPDVNVLLYAVNGDSPQHAAARDWIEQAFGRTGGLAFTWPALVGFVRLATRSGIFAKPMAVEDALTVVDVWLDHPRAHVIAPTSRHAALLSSLLIGAGAGGNLVSDAHLAALAIEHGAELGTFDRDFSRFAGLRVALLK